MVLYSGLVINESNNGVPTPDVGSLVLFAKADGTLWIKTSDGDEKQVSCHGHPE